VSVTTRVLAWLATLLLVATLAPMLAPYGPTQLFPDARHVPPMLPRIETGGRVQAVILTDRRRERYDTDPTRLLPLPWWGSTDTPVFVFGTDAGSRDILSRLLVAARPTILLALAGLFGSITLGTVLGVIAARRGGLVDAGIMRTGDRLLVLPLMVVALLVRGALPAVVPAVEVFAWLSLLLSGIAWPVVMRVVRATIREEQASAAVLAVTGLGASGGYLLRRHLLPSCAGPVLAQAGVLLPAFMAAEAGLSFVGLGFPDAWPTWGTMLRDATDVGALVRFPWTLAPAAAIFLVTLGTRMVVPTGHRATATAVLGASPGKIGGEVSRR
jgi:peptide/nickel transport system permease protein